MGGSSIDAHNLIGLEEDWIEWDSLAMEKT